MKAGLFVFFICIYALDVYSQEKAAAAFTDISFAASKKQVSFSLLIARDWKLGAKRKFGIGFGGRITNYIGSNQYYSTAPAKLTSESTSPLIIFKQNVIDNIDSLLVKSPQVNSFNLLINLDYQFNRKLLIGFNIDAFGFAIGKSVNGSYINGSTRKNITAKPTVLNLLLVSDNDRGSLNSELYAKYTMTAKWSLKAAAQFLFTEYTTTTNIQRFPDLNDRFRNKSLMLGVGVSYVIR